MTQRTQRLFGLGSSPTPAPAPPPPRRHHLLPAAEGGVHVRGQAAAGPDAAREPMTAATASSARRGARDELLGGLALVLTPPSRAAVREGAAPRHARA